MAEAKLKSTLQLTAKITLDLSEKEAKALNQITRYGIARFLEGYRKHLSSSYINPHEAGLTQLFETIGNSLPEQINKLEKYKRAIAAAESESA